MTESKALSRPRRSWNSIVVIAHERDAVSRCGHDGVAQGTDRFPPGRSREPAPAA